MASVILATYNGEKYIEKQVLSILNQTQLPKMIYVIDDGSKDGTLEKLYQLKKISSNKKVDLQISQNEKNLGYALNFWKGLTSVNDDILFLCDQDDVWFPNKVEAMVKIFKNNNDILTLNTAYKLIDEKGASISNFKSKAFSDNKKIKKIGIYDFIKSPRYPGMSMAVRGGLMNELKEIKLNSIYAHDWVLNFNAAMRDGMYFYDSILVGYRQHHNNTVGVISEFEKKSLIEHRIKTIKDQEKCLQLSKDLITDKELNTFIVKSLELLSLRKNYVEEKNFLNELILYMKYHKYVSKRCFLGDMYSILKSIGD